MDLIRGSRWRKNVSPRLNLLATVACSSIDEYYSVSFQSLVCKLYGGRDWEFVCVHYNDILVSFQFMNAHLEHLQKVVQPFIDAGLCWSREKGVFATGILCQQKE